MAGFTLSNSKRSRKRHRVLNEINVTPFVDVMLVLLIIFMVTSPMLVTGIGVDLPETQASPVAGDDEPLVISITKDKKIFLHDSFMEESELLPKLHAMASMKKETRIFVRGDKGVEYGAIMHVMGLIHASGFKKVSLITELSPHEIPHKP